VPQRVSFGLPRNLSGWGNVSLETWDFDGDKVAPGTDIRGGRFPEETVTGTTYMEMTPDQARRLIELLTEALADLSARSA
jgi:hypothetical protein